MEEKNDSLFSNSGTSPQIPFQDQTKESVEQCNESLKSPDVKEVIGGEYVKQIQIPSDFGTTLPNYVIDFRGMTEMRTHQIETLQCLIADDGDVAIYAWLANGLVKLGMGLSIKLDRVLPAGIQSVFGSKCRLYQDVETGKPVREIRTQEVEKIRLDL